MYEAGMALLDEPAELKRQLPIAYVMEQAGMRLTQGEGRLSALCPFHEDHNPSLDVYPWYDAERWGCWACGAGGDVFDFIMRMWPMGFRDAVAAAKRAYVKMQAEGWVAPKLQPPPPWDEGAARKILLAAEFTGVDDLCAKKGWRFYSSWLYHRWSVGAYSGELLVPYFCRGNLVAMKHRPLSGARPLISLPGSQLKNVLYGEWLDTGSPRVLLTEGESDAWSADFVLPRSMCDILSIPSGVSSTPTGLETLAGREVWIGFDGDQPGLDGSARWRDELIRVGCKVYRLPVPNGLDLSTVPDIAALVECRMEYGVL